jgi:hypothetical protein
MVCPIEYSVAADDGTHWSSSVMQKSRISVSAVNTRQHDVVSELLGYFAGMMIILPGQPKLAMLNVT